jgi:hypothetical protein
MVCLLVLFDGGRAAAAGIALWEPAPRAIDDVETRSCNAAVATVRSAPCGQHAFMEPIPASIIVPGGDCHYAADGERLLYRKSRILA